MRYMWPRVPNNLMIVNILLFTYVHKIDRKIFTFLSNRDLQVVEWRLRTVLT